MGLFFSIFSLVMTMLPGVVHTIQAVAGDVTAGKTKEQMALDALNGAATTAATSLTGGNAELAQLAAGAVMLGIQSSNMIGIAVKNAKNTPAFKSATDRGNALQAQIASMASTNASSTAAPAGTPTPQSSPLLSVQQPPASVATPPQPQQ